MWPLPTIKEEIVSIALSPRTLTCSWIQQDRKRAMFYLKAHTQTPLTSFEYSSAGICNQTNLARQIISFLKAYNLHNAYVVMSSSGPAVVESVIELGTQSPQATDFAFPKLRSLVWEYRYMHPADDRFAYYICGMKREHIAQHQLLALRANMHLTALTTERAALLRLYQYRYGTTFRPSQLAKDLELHNNDMHALFSADAMRRMMTMPTHPNTDAADLAVALGLYILGKDSL